ncbi:hypothetical protein [Amycolatopsis sp. lyj-23]|uniref:hypothetical protein n=1 Tax=Amycolatopsis sp. lyj-23 TaxID=2789283 RepID=UPI003979B6AA
MDESAVSQRNRLIVEGKLLTYESEDPVLSLDELEELSRGWGTAVSEALNWTRGEW